MKSHQKIIKICIALASILAVLFATLPECKSFLHAFSLTAITVLISGFLPIGMLSMLLKAEDKMKLRIANRL